MLAVQSLLSADNQQVRSFEIINISRRALHQPVVPGTSFRCKPINLAYFWELAQQFLLSVLDFQQHQTWCAWCSPSSDLLTGPSGSRMRRYSLPVWLRIWRSVEHFRWISFRYHLSKEWRHTWRHPKFCFRLWTLEPRHVCWCRWACRTWPRSCVSHISAQLNVSQ